MTKGKNPFAGWQASAVNERASFIKSALVELSSSQFKTTSSLAEYVAKLLTKHEKEEYRRSLADEKNEIVERKIEPKSVSKSTLLRNDIYRSLLDAFMADKRKMLGDLANDKNVPEIKIAKLQMELSKLKTENERLVKYIETIEKRKNIGFGDDQTELEKELKIAQSNFSHLANAMIQLYSSELMGHLLKLEDGSIIDKTVQRELVSKMHLACIRERLEEVEDKRKRAKRP